MDIVKKVYDTLVNAGITVPVQYGWYDKNINDTHITYLIILEVPEFESDDDIEMLCIHIQVDIWSKDDDIKLKRNVRSALRKADFIFTENKDDYEIDTKLYHKAMRFKILIDDTEE
ncbi:hypothetical protein [uncultured Clostridium sp.]|jgi:hypothetical protein|uniref:hypothetical protein n=1 Tax=uncultured Clostridium sp. TaxID=59620 RepID=UPI002611C002|nr:hypothetical protein [uncultured Clostridium sp.]